MERLDLDIVEKAKHEILKDLEDLKRELKIRSTDFTERLSLLG